MVKKAVIIIISFFLAILFLSTVGSFYTGYSVLNQKDLTMQQYPYPFIKNNVPNEVYIVIPYDFTYSEFEAAQGIANTIKGINPLPPAIVDDKNLPEGKHNLILIGNPCNNQIISDELATVECDLGLNEGEALIQLVNHDRTSTLVVSGYSSEAISKAVIVLTNYNFYPLMGTKVIIDGNVGNLVLNYF